MASARTVILNDFLIEERHQKRVRGKCRICGRNIEVVFNLIGSENNEYNCPCGSFQVFIDEESGFVAMGLITEKKSQRGFNRTTDPQEAGKQGYEDAINGREYRPPIHFPARYHYDLG